MWHGIGYGRVVDGPPFTISCASGGGKVNVPKAPERQVAGGWWEDDELSDVDVL